jgi:small conductance mechanosensitive channel
MRVRLHADLLRFATTWFVTLLVVTSASISLADATTDATDEASSTQAEEPRPPTLAEQANQIHADIERLSSEFRELKDEGRAATDSDSKAVSELRARERLVDWMRAIDALVANLLEQEETGLDARRLRQKTRKILFSVNRRLPTFLKEVADENEALRGELEEATGDPRSAIEARIRGNEATLDEAVRFYLSHINHMDRLELGSTRARADAAKSLEKRASVLAARLEFASQRLEEARESKAEAGGGEAAVHKAQEEIDRIAASLWTVCDVLDELGLPTAAHRRVLILATGELTTDVLDTEVLAELFDSALESSTLWVEQRGPVLVGRLARFFGVLLIFWILGKATSLLTARLVTSSANQLSMLAQRILVTSAARVVLGIGFVLALSQLGVNITALLTGLGIVGFIVGFALQETLGNFAAGAMILIYDPFDVGDVIEAAGVTGTVDQMNLVSTTILTFDNQMLVIPNSRIWGNVIRNATAMKTRRVDLTFPLALDANVERAEQLFREMCQAHPTVLDDPETAIKILSVSGAGVVVGVRPWVRTEDYWSTFWDLNREANTRLQEAGIEVAAARYKLEDQKPAASR